MMFLDNFPKNLRRHYVELGLRQDEAAARCKITPQYFRQIMKGEKVPSLTVFINICIGLGVSPHEMLGYHPTEFEALCTARRQEIIWRPIQKPKR